MKPYFTGYMFVHTDLEEVGKNYFRWLPDSLGLVRFGDEPAIVPENVIHNIQQVVDAINQDGGEQLDGLKPGDEILVDEGPFKGYRGVFDTRLSGTERVCVLLSMLQEGRKLPVELDARQIRKE